MLLNFYIKMFISITTVKRSVASKVQSGNRSRLTKMLFLILTAAATYTVLLIAGAAFTLTCLGNIGFTKTVGKA